MVTTVKSNVNTSVSVSASAYCYTLKEPNYENQYLASNIFKSIAKTNKDKLAD
jgi:hypothetical protein